MDFHNFQSNCHVFARNILIICRDFKGGSPFLFLGGSSLFWVDLFHGHRCPVGVFPHIWGSEVFQKGWWRGGPHINVLWLYDYTLRIPKGPPMEGWMNLFFAGVRANFWGVRILRGIWLWWKTQCNNPEKWILGEDIQAESISVRYTGFFPSRERGNISHLEENQILKNAPLGGEMWSFPRGYTERLTLPKPNFLTFGQYIKWFPKKV